jgi:hypothetical protein
MNRLRNLFFRKQQFAPVVSQPLSAVIEAEVDDVTADEPTSGRGVHYLATHRGFLKGFESRYDEQHCGEIVPVFTGNIRFAQQFDSFQAADTQGKQLATTRPYVKYYAIVKPA